MKCKYSCCREIYQKKKKRKSHCHKLLYDPPGSRSPQGPINKSSGPARSHLPARFTKSSGPARFTKSSGPARFTRSPGRLPGSRGPQGPPGSTRSPGSALRFTRSPGSARFTRSSGSAQGPPISGLTSIN